MVPTSLRRRLLAASSPLLVILVAGCEVEKSKSPLSPSVAGPIAGVEITAPRVLEPSQGTRIRQSQQPIRLTVENASTNGVRPLSYSFELATDEAFQNRLYARSNVVPGDGGRTWVQLDRIGTGGTYFWRARAEDGANIGPYVSVRFEVLPPPELSAPALLSPINNERTGSQRPTLIMGAPTRNSAIGPLTYEVQVAFDVAFSQLVFAGAALETGGQTTIDPGDLPPSRQHFWRARATDAETTSVWAATQTFLTPAAPAPPPVPAPGPNPGAPCNSSNAEAIVSCERAKFGHMSHGDMYAFVRAVAQSLNRNGIGGGPFGILRKANGTSCNGYSCDVICAGQGGGQQQYDVLGDIDGAQTPGWGLIQGSIRVDVCEVQ
jgi:hypothetical protein